MRRGCAETLRPGGRLRGGARDDGAQVVDARVNVWL